MSLYKSFVKHVSFPIISRRDGLPGIKQTLSDLEESQFWPQERMEEYQQNKIKSILIHAYENTGFYKKRFDDADMNPYKYKGAADLKNIPVLTKNQIRENVKSMLATNYSKKELHSSDTGGTTGVKMTFYRDNACLSTKEATRYRFEKWTGWDIGERIGLVWTAQQDYVGHWTTKAKIRNELFERQIVLPAAILDDDLILKYLKDLLAKSPTMIRAFSSPLYEVARIAQEYKFNFTSLKGIVTTGEPVYGHQRQLIEKAFSCKVFDSYRSRDAGPIAQECEYHNGLHINAESLFIETIPRNENTSDDESGEIVITDLLNYGMPLIRYKMGDLGILSNEICSCGRCLPLIKKIAGRSADTLYSIDKRPITAGSLVLYLVDEAPGLLGQVQIIQDKIDHLCIRLTPDPEPTQEIIEYQKNKVHELFGGEMEVTFELVNEIPMESSGKYLFTKCLLTEKELN